MDSISQQHEIRHFWRCSGALRDAQRLGSPPAEIAEWIDELEVLAMHTDSPSLRSRCNALLAENRTSAASSAGLTVG
jgi:hypothetical protein